MGNKTFRGLNDFIRHKTAVDAYCARCRRHGTLNAHSLARYFMLKRWPTALDMGVANRHIRCRFCHLPASELRPSANATEPNPVLDRNEEEWTQLQRRLRG
jgi:hypothetical protein